jgi:uncharacterized protein (DUF433 family)
MVSKNTVDEIEMMSEMGMSISEIADALELSDAQIEDILDKNIVEGD